MVLGTKKRWRIGGRNNNKSSKSSTSKDGDNDNEDTPTTPDTSDDSHASGEVDDYNYNCNSINNGNGNSNGHDSGRLNAPMSDVDDSDDDDDDIYLDNEKGDENNVNDDVRKPPTIPENATAEDDNDNRNDDTGSNNANDTNTNTVVVPPSTSTIEDDDDSNYTERVEDDDYPDEDEDHSNYEEDMERHRQECRSSAFLSGVLQKIEEESNPNDDNDSNSNVNINIGSGIDNERKNDANESGNRGNGSKGGAPPPQRPKQHVAAVPKAIAAVYKDKARNIIHLPSARELSKELCKIVATDHYSGAEFLRALERLSEWAHTQDTTLLKHFLTYGGVVKVVDFLREQIEDPGCEGEFFMECIHKACDVICNACFVGKHGINEDIAVVNATVVVKYQGIETLLLASREYNESNKSHPLALKASEGVWNAIMNVYCNAEAAITKTISMLVLDAGLQMLARIGSVDHPIAAETIANVFNTFYRITYHNYLTRDEFRQMNILTHCLDIFKRDVVTSSEGDEELLEEAISFLHGCHEKGLFDTKSNSSDYERVLPLCVMGLREYARDNANIREWATKLLDGACSNVHKKETIMLAEGAIEALAPFLTSEDVDASEKDVMRKLIRKIIAA